MKPPRSNNGFIVLSDIGFWVSDVESYKYFRGAEWSEHEKAFGIFRIILRSGGILFHRVKSMEDYQGVLAIFRSARST